MTDTSAANRTVHATVVASDGWTHDVVRYEREGKWRIEPRGFPGHMGRWMPIGDVVEWVRGRVQNERASLIWRGGMPGGTQFDARMRRHFTGSTS